MVAECPAKCVKIRLREKTPTLRCGKYVGYSVRDVFHHNQGYWNQCVAHHPIRLLGSLSRFIEIDAREQLVNRCCRFDQLSKVTKSTAEPSPPEPLPVPSLSEETPTGKCGATSSAALPANQVEPGEPKPDSLTLQSLSDAVLAQTEANRDTAATLKVVGALVEESTEIQPLTIPIELARSNSQALMVAFRRKRGRPPLTEAQRAARAETRARYVHEFVNSVLVA